MKVKYKEDANITWGQAISLYTASSLGERRPIDRPDIFKGMLDNASITITAWAGTKLVGIARTLTDYTYVAYLADLVVDREYQRMGIGKKLIQETEARLARECMIVVLASPDANAYYPKLGFKPNPRGWVLNRDSPH